jgi:hypothetical protein
MHASTPPTLDIAGLETVYDLLATAIDAAGPRAELLLVKLALLQARELGDAQRFADLLRAAQADL